jgi:hypothetical protein
MMRPLHVTVAALAVAVLGATPAAADFTLQRQLALAPGGTFILDTDVGSVSVTGDAPSGAQITLTSVEDDFASRYDISVDESAGTASMRVRRRMSWLDEIWSGGWWHNRNVRITVRVPRSTTVSLDTSGGAVTVADLGGNARLRTSGGRVRARNVDGDIDARTSGGGIDIADVRGNVRAGTSGGGIEVDSVRGAIDVRTSGGGIRVRDAGGRVDARTSGGSVVVGFARGNAQGGDIHTSGGSVTAHIDPAVALSVDASTSGGGVDSDVPVTVRGRISRNELRGDLNGGGALLRLRSSGGGVRVAATTASR